MCVTGTPLGNRKEEKRKIEKNVTDEQTNRRIDE
jgi:hypothetical protein